MAYFAGVSDYPTTIPAIVWSGDTFQTHRVDMQNLLFTEAKENAKTLSGRTNMKSYLNRILEQLPYFQIEIDEIRIELLKGGE